MQPINFSGSAGYINVNGQQKENILPKLVDHDGKGINNPWIEKTNNNANNGIDGAQIVWADEANLVNLDSNPIYRDGNGNAFVKFEVTKANNKKR